MYGRSDDEWDSLIDNTIPVLERIAANEDLTNYTELNLELANLTGVAPFDFSLERDRVAVGAVLPRRAGNESELWVRDPPLARFTAAVMGTNRIGLCPRAST